MPGVKLPGLALGAIQISYALSTLLFGLTTIQLYFYLRHFPHDSKILKALVWIIRIADLGHQICSVHLVFWFYITNFESPLRTLVLPAPRTIAGSLFFSAFIGLIVQSFFAFRLWKATKRTIVFCSLLVIITARCCLACVLGALESGTPIASFVLTYRPFMILTWAISAATDLLMTILLTYDLHTRRSGLFYKTSQIIDRLIMRIVVTGMLTSFCTISMAICFATMNNLVWAGISLIIPRMFSNSLLSSLNSRRSLRRMDSSDVRHSTLQFGAPAPQMEDSIELQSVESLAESMLETQISDAESSGSVMVIESLHDVHMKNQVDS